ncbi:MAG: flippase [Patescibacteria group bacterium]
MNLGKKVAHNTLLQIIGKIISTILGLFALAIITRQLGLGGFGEYTTVLTFLTFFAVIGDLGLTLVTAQMISGRNENENKILNNLFGLRLVSAILILALAPLTVSFFPYSPAVKFGVLISLGAFLFPALNQIIIGLFQKKLSMGRDVLAETISRLTLIAGILVVRSFGGGLNGILIATLISAGVNFIFHYFLSLKFAFIRPEFDWVIWKKIFNKSWPLAITIVLNLIYLRADTLILSLFRSPEEVGLYGATYKIIDVLTAIPFMFAGLLLPILTAAWEENNQTYFKKVLQKSFDFMAIGALPLIVGAQFLGRPIMALVAGPDFAAAGNILRVLILAVAAIFLGTIFSHAVIALDRQKKMIGFYMFTSLSSLAAYFFLIPRFSYFAAAGVTIYSEVMIAIFSAYCVFKYSRFWPKLKITAISLLSSALMGGFLYFFGPRWSGTIIGLLALLILSGLIYFAGLLLLGGIKKTDLQMIFKNQKKSSGPVYGGENL